MKLNNHTDADTLLRRRVLARFPLGSSESGLEEYLKAHRFKVVRTARGVGHGVFGQATLKWGGPISGTRAGVQWRASKDGTLTEIGTFVEAAGLFGELSKF